MAVNVGQCLSMLNNVYRAMYVEQRMSMRIMHVNVEQCQSMLDNVCQCLSWLKRCFQTALAVLCIPHAHLWILCTVNILAFRPHPSHTRLQSNGVKETEARSIDLLKSDRKEKEEEGER